MVIELKSKIIRYESNPFLDSIIIKTGSKKVTVNPSFGKDDNVLVNQSTGEVKGTHITTYKTVDATKFVKLFTQNIALTFDLTSAGIKTFNVLMFAVQAGAINKDLVPLDRFTLADFMKENDVSLSTATFTRGLGELVKAKIIARHTRQGFYYINPNFVFNGDRLAFTTIIEKKNEETKR